MPLWGKAGLKVQNYSLVWVTWRLLEEIKFTTFNNYNTMTAAWPVGRGAGLSARAGGYRRPPSGPNLAFNSWIKGRFGGGGRGREREKLQQLEEQPVVTGTRTFNVWMTTVALLICAGSTTLPGIVSMAQWRGKQPDWNAWVTDLKVSHAILFSDDDSVPSQQHLDAKTKNKKN